LKRAIVSDIHGNLEALTAVLADIAAQQIDTIYCLGDIIGYGPNPCECIDLALQFKVCVLGNHDQGALFDPEGFSSGAERAIFWTRRQLETAADGDANERRWNFLLDMPRIVNEDNLMFVHGSARNPLNEYVFPEDIYQPKKLEKIFSIIPRHCFQGHTHVPGVFLEGNRFMPPHEIGHRYHLGSEKAMINVGSVGQPRDGDPRSCYVVLDGNQVEFRRVAYNLEATCSKIYAIEELENFLGDRLREGR
jgi:predicted phosphodiesterase